MPQARPGIIKSGNSGNSSKASKASGTETPANPLERPLFPPGYKYPTSLLNEKCQKNGWGKAIVDTRKLTGDGGFIFSVSISRTNPKTSQTETVRLEPHPPYILPTAAEARQWGATYALYRFCNGFKLQFALPPGPREYWKDLATEHKNAPDHQDWMYEADPFAAQRMVDERQAKKGKESDAKKAGTRAQTSREYDQAPEVKMASDLRNVVEDAIKKAISLYPEAADTDSTMISEPDASQVLQQLGRFGFTPNQAQNAIKFLSLPSPFTTNLLSTLSPLEAAIEYLVLHVPECDLPERFLPAANSSEPFVTSVHSGSDDLKRRWVEDKAIKEGGWPAHVVRQCTSDQSFLDSWELLITALNSRLIGEDWSVTPDNHGGTPGMSDLFRINQDEVEALGGQYASPSEVMMPLFTAPVRLHILVIPCNSHQSPTYPPMYITSEKVPPYIRLHLLSRLLKDIKKSDFLEPGEGFCLAAMQVLEDEWATIEDNGPPEMSVVFQHLLPRPSAESSRADVLLESATLNKRDLKGKAASQNDTRDGGRVRSEFEEICSRDEYGRMLLLRQKLPSFSVKDKFLDLLQKSRVVIVVGETGCGKTTQLPQFILDSLIQSKNGSSASIVVTQPRRISALSVAARVSAERLDDGSVGYAIRGESKRDSRTKLFFCTTGVVLRRLSSGDRLEGVTHVIVDEVHERSLDGDFLLLELKELLSKHLRLKVVLMSATINHEVFVKYFGNAPLLEIPGRTYPVTDVYLEDVIPLLKYRPSLAKFSRKETEEEKKGVRDHLTSRGLDDQSVQAIQSITRSDHIDHQLVSAVVGHIIANASKRGGILIFLPGVQDIRQCIEAVKGILDGNEADILPLHANLTNDEQRRVFLPTSKWKIIAATNVAETSITIDDIIYVIDTGKVKETQYDPASGLSRLVETQVTRAAARQRRGRAGRTQAGVCYKLYTRRQEEKMESFSKPEILRVPLESISLAVKVMREDEDVKLFLSRAIDPPDTVAMEKAWSTLEELGAVDENGKLTALGRHMAMLPVDLRLAKMLVLGTIFRCLSPMLTIAACLSSKPLFISPMDKRDEATRARARFATGDSDILTDLNAYDTCIRLRTDGKSQRAIKSFCEENFISLSTLREITSLRHDFLSSLSDLGLIPLTSTPATPSLNTNSTHTNLLKALLVGGLWPRLALVHLPKSAIKFDKVQAGTVQRENTAKEFKMYDVRDHHERVFLHPGSVLFDSKAWKSPVLVYFCKYMSSKVFLRDATEVPLYALLLFGGRVSVNHVGGGVDIGMKEGKVKLKAWPRIGILVNQLRRLLDAQLARCILEGTPLDYGQENPVLIAMLRLLDNDGLTGVM